MAFMLAFSSSKLFAAVIITGMTIVFEDLASVFDNRAPFGEGEEESLL